MILDFERYLRNNKDRFGLEYRADDIKVQDIELILKLSRIMEEGTNDKGKRSIWK